ncbi:MAG: VWA domain-containing protein [Candidatus Binatia bacterium]
MATSEDKNQNQTPTSVEDHVREDMWLYGGQGWGKNARWFAFSTVTHVLVLALFATLSISMVQQRRDLIKVQTLPLSPEELAQRLAEQQKAEEEVPEDWEGEPSLDDLPGLLTMEQVTAKSAKTTIPREGEAVKEMKATAVPDILTGFGPAIAAGSARLTDTVAPFGDLAGVVGGTGTGFGDYNNALRKAGMDIVLVVDTSDSTQFVINSVKTRLLQVVAALRAMVPTSRIGIVAYRDKGDEYVTKWLDLTFSDAKLKDFLSALNSGGGGDWPEAVHDAMQVAVNDLRWGKRAKRIIILVPASPPHPESVGGVMALAQGHRAQGGVVSVVDLAEKMHEDFERVLWQQSAKWTKEPFKPGPLPGFYKEFRDLMSSIARAGGGEFVPFTEEKALTREIIATTFGTRWKTEMAKYLRDLE